MKKNLLVFAFVICNVITVLAQDAQTDRNQTFSINICNVQYVHHGEKLSAGEAVGKMLTGLATGQTSVEASKYESDVKNAIVKGLSTSYRFRFDDSLTSLSKDIKEGSIIVDAIISNIQSKSSSYPLKDNDKKTYVSTTYTGLVEVLLNLKDAKTGDVIVSPSFSGQSSTGSTYSTPDQAVKNAIEKLSNRITDWLNKYRPLQANIIEGSTAKKDKQKEVYIDLGSSEGAFAGLHMGVFMIKTVAGREAKTQIGKLKIEAVEGDDISLCKVQSGGKEIKAAIEAGHQLRVISL